MLEFDLPASRLQFVVLMTEGYLIVKNRIILEVENIMNYVAIS